MSGFSFRPFTSRAIMKVAAAAAVIAVACVLALAYGTPYGSGNQVTYLLEPLRRAYPELYRHDWLVTTTTQYHPVFAWLAAPLYQIDPGSPGGPGHRPGELAFAIGQLIAMVATFALLYRLVAAIADVRVHGPRRLAMFVLLLALLVVGGGRALAGSYLFAGYLQPSSLATLGWLAAMLAWLRGHHLRAGLWLAAGGVFHINFLILGIGLFGLVELSAGGLSPRRLAAVLAPSLIALIGFVPALLAGSHASDPDTALTILSKFHAPGHYDPGRVRRWLPPLIAWLVVAWGGLPIARAAGGDVALRLWRFAAIATALSAAATAIASFPPLLGATRLFVWRIAPFGQLAAQVLVIAAALGPAAPGMSGRRIAALVAGALVLIGESMYLGGGHYVFTFVLAGIAVVWIIARPLGRPGLASALAIASLVVPLVVRRAELREPPLFAGECWNRDCALLDWVRTRTAVDAVFLVPPYAGWFRLLAQRAVVADTKSPPLYPDELIAWYRRLCAIVDAPDLPTHQAVEARWDTLTADQLTAVAHRFAVDYLVLDKARSPARPGQAVAFETDHHIVYRLR